MWGRSIERARNPQHSAIGGRSTLNSIPYEPHFSIIIPTFNRAWSVTRAIESALSQDYEDFEIIVIDDASTDKTQKALKTYDGQRLRIVNHRVNQGVCAARASGIRIAQGRWCVWLDSDFELLPRSLANLADLCADSPAPEIVSQGVV